MKLMLPLLYPLLIAARLLNGLTGRDPLRLRRPSGESYWIPRAAQPTSASYFSEESVAEGYGSGGWGRIAGVPLRWLAKLYAPGEVRPGETFSAAADREQGIPDEIYTLW